MKRYRINIEILSPVHIGTNEELDPLNYIIKESVFYRINLEKFLVDLEESLKQDFYGLVDSDDINGLRKFIIDNCDLSKYSLYSASVTKNIQDNYTRNIGNINNQLLVDPFIRSFNSFNAYIPGSSLKGAIRTAIISERAKNKRYDKNDRNLPKYFEGDVLSYGKDIRKDPFRTLKIDDTPLPEGSIFIAEIFNMVLARGGMANFKGMQIFKEVTESMVSKAPISLDTYLSIDDNLQEKRAVSSNITLQEIIESCNKFYSPKLEKEHIKFYARAPVRESSEKLLNIKLSKNQFLLRLGRFSQVECVTVDNFRNPKSRKGWGNSRNICEKKYPMGWIKISLHE